MKFFAMKSFVSVYVGGQRHASSRASLYMTEPENDRATAKIGNNLLTLTKELQS